MRVSVLLFAGLRTAVGSQQLAFELPDGATVRQAAERLEAEHPEVSLRGVMCAVNESYATPASALTEGDVVAFLPPVSGG